ncbi:hypothetical protein IFM89_016584 [Coptis chinensis]|uniref:Phosphatidic acid phosphatase type 2/haloperoxidase domain-containing protein n=1 Tax=Coptis chinensis TaxID=261450 RepID=A0A835I3V8_9MAGN|nr:hypothetical protein IFM89_016584 [Coptis chinensis]
MSTTITYNPTTTTFTFLPRHQSLKHTSSHLHKFPISSSKSRYSFKSKENKMAELVTSSGLRTSDGHVESYGVMETEAILSNGSSEFRSRIDSDGFESAINKLSKWLVAALFGAIILWRHDAEALWAAMGAVMNAWLSVGLKQILNQERPIATLRSDPGMPSSHAQSIFFAIIFAILSMVKLLGINEFTVAVGMLALASGSYLSWLRVSQKLHTISQVSVGAVLGTILSILWFQAWYAFVLKAFIASLWVRMVVVLGSAAVCVCFLVYIIQYWLMEEP